MSEPSPLTPALQRAQTLIAAGDLGGAVVLLERAVELGRENLGEDHHDVLTAQRDLAGVLLRIDEPVNARRALEEAYAAGHLRLGDTDPLMVLISHDLGLVADELGNRHEARKAFGRVAEHGPAALGVQHPAVARARAFLGQEQSDVRGEAPPPQPAQPTTPAPVEQRWDPPTRPVEADPMNAPTAPVEQRWDPPTPAAPVEPTWDPPTKPVETDPMNAPTGAFPTLQPTDQSPWSAPPGQAVPTQTRRNQEPPPPPGNPWTDHGATVQPPPPTMTPWSADTVDDDRHSRNTPGGVTIWNGAPPPAAPPPSIIPAASVAHAYPVDKAPESGRRRGMALFAVIAATLSAVVAVAALVFVLADRTGTPGTAPAGETDVPTQEAIPPGDISLTDEGTAVEVRWTDPAGGTVPFMVTMARPGETLRPVSSVGPGETSFRMGGLSKRLDYCFAVVAVYATDNFKTSDQVCTERG
ncbi:tetratricopeptide repeat protein [Actinoplanes sp. NPDC051861]|uniref:fibronectin type III domain-containing protein n=1 Tax=Actinoplanes sp. NPDC051861 TaxID=3155170 RepID=UPI00344A536C